MGKPTSTKMPAAELMSFPVPSWDKLIAPTAWLCCNCEFYFEIPQCLGCVDQGTCLCCTRGCSCGMNWEECDYLCYCQGESFCISLEQCSADCKGHLVHGRLPLL